MQDGTNQSSREAAAPAMAGAAPGRGWRRWVWRLMRIALIAYLSAFLVFSMFQTWFIFPGSFTQGKASSQVRPEADTELVQLRTASGETIVALFGRALTPTGQPHPEASHRPTVMYFYGNGNCLADTADGLPGLRRMGINVLLPEFVGYGMSSGKAGEQGCYETADAAYDYLLTRTDIDHGKIVVAGWSLGAAVAIDLASRRPVAGLVTFSAFTSMLDMANKVMPFFPNSLILRHRFENERKVRDIACPMFIAHGRRDALIPYRMCERLVKARGARPTTCYTVDSGDHNDIFGAGGDAMFSAVGKFLDSLDGEGAGR
jgi:fermentation-respiration switch protein FrsA (DUF1100 family)